MPLIPLDCLHPHPDNANRMPPRLLKKLVAHVRDHGDYPPLIVRRHPEHADQYQILDGHHRAEALRQLKHAHANCEVWNVDNERAALLLLTLNRLHGEDDPLKRGGLIARLNQSYDLKSLSKFLPDDAKAIRKLMNLTLPPTPLAPPPTLADMPHAVTFFLTQMQRDRLFERLDSISDNRSRALAQLLELDN